MNLRALWFDLLAAVQFLTRVPVPAHPYREDSLPRAVKFFPLVGVLVGAAAAAVYLLLDPHLPRGVTAALTLCFLLLVTGCLHEDGLADAADGFGGGWTREQTLTIFRDSRIGSYGGAALALSLLLRWSLLASFARASIVPTLIAAHVLCRWSTLPLSRFLPPARAASDGVADGQGARVARLTTTATLIGGTVFAFACAALLMHGRGAAAIAASMLVVLLSGLYYNRRIGGVTGDCFGATNQLTEIAVYACAVWVR